MTNNLRDRAEQLAEEYADEFVKAQAIIAIESALREIVEICASEADESYIGGKARNMHKGARKSRLRKAVVLGMLERNGKVRTQIIEGAYQADMQHIIRQHVTKGSTIHTDEHKGYRGLAEDYTHNVINHARAYVQGNVHTQGIENFWSLLKRGIRGTYVSVEPFHLFRYLDEQTFRFNTRKDTDKDRFLTAVSTVGGKRVMYQQLVGQTSL